MELQGAFHSIHFQLDAISVCNQFNFQFEWKVWKINSYG